MAQVNAAENIIIHERTIKLDTARQDKEFNFAGWYLRVIKVSSANVTITSKVDNEQSEPVSLTLGAGWKHRYFNKLLLSWDAQPGESITIALGGNPLTYDPHQFEVYVPSVTSAVEISNTDANRVPVDIDEPLVVQQNDEVQIAPGSEPILIEQGNVIEDVDSWLPAGTTFVELGGTSVIGNSNATVYTVPASKVLTVTTLFFTGQQAGNIGKLWVEDGSGNVVWQSATAGDCQPTIAPPYRLTLPAGYLIRARAYIGNQRCVGAGYLTDA